MRRRPILTLIADTSPGPHDMLIAACDSHWYSALGAPDHRSCADNLVVVPAYLQHLVGTRHVAIEYQ